MSGLVLKIIDDEGKETEPSELTEIGRAMVREMARNLIEVLTDIDAEKEE